MGKIGLCGAHGSGKTTLLNILTQKHSLNPIARTMRDMLENFGVSDFEKLPTDVRNIFQKYALINQINRESTEGGENFITDRTVIDNLGYTLLSSDMSGIDLKMYQTLVLSHFQSYTHFIYVPVEFEAPQETLRADVNTSKTWDEIVQTWLKENVKSDKYLIISGSPESRISQIEAYCGF